MLKIIKNKIVTGVVASLFIVMSQSAFTFDVSGESFPANFKMTSWTAGNGESTITSEGIVGEGYGKVYLTHNFNVSAEDGMSGGFTGWQELLSKMVRCKWLQGRGHGAVKVKWSQCILLILSIMAL